MAILRRVARPLLASTFITGGIDALRNPARLVPLAKPVTDPVTEAVSQHTSLPSEDPERLVLAYGAVQVGAGALLALGRAPRWASLALAATLVPSTLATHRFWTVEDPEERADQRARFLRDAALLGGLLIAAADTHGKPSLAYRTRGAAGHASDAVAHQAHAVADRVGDAAGAAVGGLTGTVDAVRTRLP